MFGTPPVKLACVFYFLIYCLAAHSFIEHSSPITDSLEAEPETFEPPMQVLQEQYPFVLVNFITETSLYPTNWEGGHYFYKHFTSLKDYGITPFSDMQDVPQELREGVKLDSRFGVLYEPGSDFKIGLFHYHHNKEQSIIVVMPHIDTSDFSSDTSEEGKSLFFKTQEFLTTGRVPELIQKQHPEKTIYLTGYSQGGRNALIAALNTDSIKKTYVFNSYGIDSCNVTEGVSGSELRRERLQRITHSFIEGEYVNTRKFTHIMDQWFNFGESNTLVRGSVPSPSAIIRMDSLTAQEVMRLNGRNLNHLEFIVILNYLFTPPSWAFHTSTSLIETYNQRLNHFN